MFRLSSAAAVNVYAMLDPIAIDCLYLNAPDLETLWSTVFEHADGVIYISDFVGDQFRRRFRLRAGPAEVGRVSFGSTAGIIACETAPQPDGHILVIGNHFDHKRIPATADALAQAFPDRKIVVIGVKEYRAGNVVSYRSGEIAPTLMEELWAGATFVIFPSTYEGFGFPVVESMAHRKPILARDLPPVRAIREKMGSGPQRDPLFHHPRSDRKAPARFSRVAARFRASGRSFWKLGQYRRTHWRFFERSGFTLSISKTSCSFRA